MGDTATMFGPCPICKKKRARFTMSSGFFVRATLEQLNKVFSACDDCRATEGGKP